MRRHGWTATSRTAGILFREAVFYGGILLLCVVGRRVVLGGGTELRAPLRVAAKRGGRR